MEVWIYGVTVLLNKERNGNVISQISDYYFTPLLNICLSKEMDVLNILKYLVSRNEYHLELCLIIERIKTVHYDIKESKKLFTNNIEELNCLSIDILEKNTINEELFIKYECCWTEKDDRNCFILGNDVNEYVKDIADKNPIEFLENVYLKDYSFRGIDDMYIFRWSIVYIFRSDTVNKYDGFEEYIKQLIEGEPENDVYRKVWNYWCDYRDNKYMSFRIQ